MKYVLAIGSLFVLAALVAVSGRADSGSDELGRTATWELPSAAGARTAVFEWFDARSPNPVQRRKAESKWPAEAAISGSALLERAAEVIAAVEPRATAVLNFARTTNLRIPDVAWLNEEGTAPIVRNNLKTLLARGLVQRLYFDESLAQLQGIEPADVIDPVSLLFYRSVAYHRLLKQEEGLYAIDRLLERERQIPRRYAKLAELMRADLARLKDDSLDHISRRMEDVERRLHLGRANKKVRDIEDGVIESLDKLIKKMEDQQSSSSSSSGGGSQSARPAPDSRILGGKGPGNVTKRKIGDTSGWGQLPQKDREEALQEIGRDFPPYYRDIIKEYFRDLAKESARD